jgi:hypothetical protein
MAVLGLILGLPALWMGFFLDDYAHRLALMDVPGIDRLFRSPMQMFSFVTGDPDTSQWATEMGVYPWWTSKNMVADFWRPATVATHWVDYLLWPDTPFLMHLHSLLWFSGLIAAVAVLYRRIGSTAWAAGLAALLFAVDDAHAFPMGWIANRNATLAVFWGVVCLLMHDLWRRDGKTAALIPAMIALALGLHSNENGVAATAYLFSYAVFIDKAPPKSRVLSLVPYALLVIVWRAYYSAMGFGVGGTLLYVDPLSSPLGFLAALFERAPILLLGQWANTPSELFIFLPDAAQAAYWLVAAVILALILVALRPVLRQSAEARFWFLGMLLAVVPISASVPMNRHLLFAGVGAAGVLAHFIAMVRAGEFRAGRYARAMCSIMLVLHLIVAPVMLSGTLVGMGVVGRATNRLLDSAQFPDDITDSTVLLVNSPNAFLTAYTGIKLAIDGKPVPAHMYVLSPIGLRPAPTRVTRTDERTLHYVPDGGFPWLIFRNETEPFAVGDRVELPEMTVEVLKVNDIGQPHEVNYRFRLPLEDPTYHWTQIESLRYTPFTPPAVGETVQFNLSR